MVTAVNSTHTPTPVQPASRIDDVNLRTHQDFATRYTDTLQSLKGTEVTTKPTLEPTLPQEHISPAIVFARMMDTIQKYVKTTAMTAELKHEQVGRKIQKAEAQLRNVQKQALEAKQASATWNTRHMVANCVLNGVTTLTGVGLAAAGDPWTGGSLIVSGVGSTASELMKYYNWNSTLTAATSIVSGVVGLFGGLGSGIGHLVRNPTLFMKNLTTGSVPTILGAIGSVTSLISTGLSGYSMVERNKTNTFLSELEALHTQTDTSLRLLQQKYSSAATGFQGTTKSFSGLFKTIAKTHNRYTRDCMRMLTADFPA